MKRKSVVIAGMLLMLIVPVSTASALPALQINGITRQCGSLSATINNVGTSERPTSNGVLRSTAASF